MTDFSIQRIEEADTEEVMRLLRRTFFIHEPLNQKIGYCKSENDDCPDLDNYCRYCLPGISFKATDAEGNIIGVLINGVSAVNNPIDYPTLIKNCISPKFGTILQMLDIRESGAQVGTKYPDEKELFEVKLAATDEKWGKKGVMARLMEETEKAARELGLRILRIDTSSAYSAKAAEKLGFKCIYQRAYTDITMNGEPMIVPDPPHIFDKVYIKELF